MGDNHIKEWVELAMRNEDIDNCTINVEGKTNKGEGYLSNIAFLTVIGNTKSGTKKEYNLVIKWSETSNNLRKQMSIDQNFKTEIHVYDDVKPAFETFQQEKGINNSLGILPHCYATQISADVGEMLILENVKPKGYDVWDRKIPMNFDHIKLTLEIYGKWHAFSLALKKEKPEAFAKLAKNNKNMFGYMVIRVKMVNLMLECFEKARNSSIFPHEKESQLRFSEEDVRYIFSDLYEEDPPHQVILHGDSWTNNFMFKYQNDTKKPSNLRILDWQCSGYASPVMDLSYFIYSCCDTGKYQDIEELLKIYYNSLNQYLKLFGHDVEDLFSYDNLKEHWKRFSRYGLLVGMFILKLSLCDEEEAPDLGEAAERGKAIVDAFRFELKDPNLYLKRVRDNILHYVKNLK